MFNTWEEFVDQFKRTFIDNKANTVERMKCMLSRVQSESETVADYFHHKARLCRELDMLFGETKQQIAAGLRSRDLCFYLLARHHDDEESLCNDLMSFVYVNDTRSQYFKKDNINSTNRKPQHLHKNELVNFKSIGVDPITVSESAVSNKKFIKLPPRNDKNEPLCYNCFTYGHVSKYCRKPKREKCTRCGKYGHAGESCTVNMSDKPVVSLVSLSPNMINEKYFFDAIVDKQQVKAYVDTGSQLCLMRKSDADRVGLSIMSLPNPIEIRGYGEGKLVPLGVVMVQLQVDHATSKVPLHIVPDEAQTIPLIVGQPFTE